MAGGSQLLVDGNATPACCKLPASTRRPSTHPPRLLVLEGAGQLAPLQQHLVRGRRRQVGTRAGRSAQLAPLPQLIQSLHAHQVMGAGSMEGSSVLT